MGKLKIPLIGVFLLMFLGSMFYLGRYMKSNGQGIVAGPDILAPTSFDGASVATGPTALLTKEAGVVMYKLPNASEFKTLDTDEANVPTGTTIKTDNTALAHVVFPDNSLMSLSKDTEVVLNFEDKKIKIVQLLGNTWHRVEKVLQGNSYEVETPNMLATVRGTEFNVGILPNNESELYVMESVVDVTKMVKKDGLMVEEETQSVQQDKHILVPKSDTPAKMRLVNLPANKKNTDWFERNKKLTEQIRKAEVDAEKEDSKKNPEVTSTPESIDEIRQKVRNDMMRKLKENRELKEIDAKFPTPTPSSDKSRTGLNSLRDADQVLGANDKNDKSNNDSSEKDRSKDSNKDKDKNDRSGNKDPNPTATPTIGKTTPPPTDTPAPKDDGTSGQSSNPGLDSIKPTDVPSRYDKNSQDPKKDTGSLLNTNANRKLDTLGL